MAVDKPPQSETVVRRVAWPNTAIVLLVALLVLAGLVHLQRSDPSVLSDDEGGYAYAAWRIGLGEVPYKDFLTPQMPVFLYAGGLIERVFGRSIVALRLLTLAVMLAAACLLFAINRELFGASAGLLSVAFFLTDANILHNARFYRPEAYMLLFDLAGIYAFVLAEKRGRMGYTWLASGLFGLAITSKLFGFLPLAGCYAYLLYAWWRERRPARKVLWQSVALGVPALAWVGVVATVFMHVTPYFLTAVLEHHTMQGAYLTWLQRIAKALRLYRDYVLAFPLAVALVVLGALSLLRRKQALPALYVWQLPTVLSFCVLSRSIRLQHLTYLAPAMATLMAAALQPLLSRSWRFQALVAVLAAAVIIPSVVVSVNPLLQTAHDTAIVAGLIQRLSSEDEMVICDYPGLNFAAGRRSSYWAAGLSEGAAESGQIRGAALVDDIERGNVALLLINVLGQARQMSMLRDYPEFRRYVQEHFALVAKVPTSNQGFEVYSRHDTMPLKPAIDFHGELALSGARLSGSECRGGSVVDVDTRWLTRKATKHAYHVSLRLVDATGHMWAQVDDRMQEERPRFEGGMGLGKWMPVPTSGWAPGDVVLLKHSLTVGPGVPPGTYYLIARLYAPESGVVLPPGRGDGTRLPSGEATIATVRVVPPDVPPAVEALPIAVLLQAQVSEDLDLMGTGRMPARVRTGRAFTFQLFWRARQRPAEDLSLRFALRQQGQVLQTWRADVVAGFPTSSWREGEVMLGSYVLPLGANLPAGSCTLDVQASDRTGRMLAEPIRLADDISIQPRLDEAAVGQLMSHRLQGISFAGRILLLGYSLSAQELRPGQTLKLTLYWRCLEPPGGDYKVFTHLLDSTSRIQGQRDAVPDDGEAPTSDWQPGDVLADLYEIPLSTEAPSGALQIEVGFYDPVTGERLPVLRNGEPAGEDRYLLPTTVRVD